MITGGIITEAQQRGDMRYTAGFGPGGNTSLYRYTLRREWQQGYTLFKHATCGITNVPCCCERCKAAERLNKHALFIMLNPSTADAMVNDPTVAKCMRLARVWGFGAVEVRNIFALRSTDPTGLKLVEDPVGVENDLAIVEAVNDQRTGLVVAAWGNHGLYLKRSDTVRALLKASGRPVFCFKVSLTGEPCHPLYQPERGVNPENLVRYL